MRAYENAVALVLDEIQQDVQQLVARHGVEAAGGLVKDEQLRAVAERGGDGELHFHAAGIVLYLLPLRQGESQAERIELGGVEALISGGEQPAHVPERHRLREGAVVKNYADALAQLARGALRVLSEDGYVPSVPPGEAQQQADGGAFAGAVFAYQAHYAAARQRKAHAVERKGAVALGERAHFYCVLHFVSLPRRRGGASPPAPRGPGRSPRPGGTTGQAAPRAA